MAKVLIAYASRAGHTEKIANYVAEGVRFTGNDVELKKIGDVKDAEDLKGYDAYIFGSPTYHRNMTGGMQQFLFKAEQAGLAGKLAGAFGSYTHSGDAPGIIFDTMQYVFKMKPSELGSMNLVEDQIETPDGIKAGQDYGKAVAEEL
ncbi:MAG: flavodoxin domain-containing protein [Desulfarculaceae bacterium]|nr:flavodoxin domain-containing protein [Desulfarculaceae bacterium]MCF8073775.1 flavodoxin domain-containing protein [Desulfarculaceae bacterium]MCF8102016.1 flavodoxin domain-containing protein [Desulfarculaceae bacterium]MCF8115986.1 flavodoxin domain-containing protein [Desulfarculaceae bacterium]